MKPSRKWEAGEKMIDFNKTEPSKKNSKKTAKKDVESETEDE